MAGEAAPGGLPGDGRSGATAPWSLRLFGHFELRAPSGAAVPLTSRKAAALLAFLALQPDRRASRERLATLFWEDASTVQARLNLRKALSTLRQEARAAAGEDLPFDATGDMVQLVAGAVVTDVARFEQALAEGDASLEATADLYAADLLQDFVVRASPAFDHWLLIERQRLRDLAIGGLCRLMEMREGKGAGSEAQAAARVLAIDPLEERAHRVLMRHHARQGRHAAALKQFHTLAEALERELGTAPEAATRELFREISRGRHQPPAPAARQPGENSPLPDEASALGGRARRLGRKTGLAIGLAATIAMGALAWSFREPLTWFVSGEVAEANGKTIAVLPFRNFSGTAEDGPFADGLTEEVINSLVQQSALQVTGRTSSFHYKDKDVDLRMIGRELGVAWVIEGSVRRFGERLRITAQLISVRDGFHLWSRTYDRPLGDAFAIQAEIADEVAKELRARIGSAPAGYAAMRPDSYRSYLTALGKLRTQRSTDMIEARAILDRLRRAEPADLRLHAAYVQATVALASTGLAVRHEEARRTGLAAVAELERLAPGSVETLFAKGLVSLYLASEYGQPQDLDLALKTLGEAARQRPRDPQILNALGRALTLRRPEAAIGVLRRATELDPMDIDAQLRLVRALEITNQAPAAIERLQSLINLYPQFGRTRTQLGRLLTRTGQFANAEPVLRAAVRDERDPVAGLWLLSTYANLGLAADFNTTATQLERQEIVPADFVRIVRFQFGRDYRGTLMLCERLLAAQPEPTWLSGAFILSTFFGEYAMARAHLAQLAPGLLAPDPKIDTNAPNHALWAAYMLRQTGDARQADAILHTLLKSLGAPRAPTPAERFVRAQAFAQLGDRSNALTELRAAAAGGYRYTIDEDNLFRTEDLPSFGRLRSDPEFRALVAANERYNAAQRETLLARRAAATRQ